MFVACHSGAGFHAKQNSKAYRKLMVHACKSTMELLESGIDALHALEHCIQLLEMHPLTNAGIQGSNIGLDGFIETDASIMSINGMASIGAVPMVDTIHTSKTTKTIEIHTSPIAITKQLYKAQEKGVDAVGRQPPIFLGGEAAHEFARYQGLKMIPITAAKSLVNEDQLNRYYRHMGILKESFDKQQDFFQDTVGAIVIDKNGNMFTGVSSGGISLKRRGRIGEAAIPGSGLFVAASNEKTVACTLSGTGEQIMKTFLATKICEEIVATEIATDGLSRALKTKFLEASILRNEEHKNMGALVVVQNQADPAMIEFCWAHTTPSFCLAYANSSSNIVYKMSRKNASRVATVQGTTIN